MELIKRDKNWFLSEDGAKTFCAISSLEERTIFIYSYLKSAVNECFVEKNTLFKIAFFFADAIYNSNKSYSKFPEILNSQTNPFLAYLERADKFQGNEKTYVIFTAILQKKADPTNSGEWIYDNDFISSENFLDALYEKEIEYLPLSDLYMVDPEAYKIKESDSYLQLEIAWMYLK